jgi:hypothetical protein
MQREDPGVVARAARLLQALRDRIGRRGLFLLLFGLYDIFYGWYLAAGGGLGHLLLVPETAWGWTWISVGAVLISGAACRRDEWFFALAALIKTAWAMEYFRSQALHIPLQWTRGCYFLVLALIVVAASSVPDGDREAAPP